MVLARILIIYRVGRRFIFRNFLYDYEAFSAIVAHCVYSYNFSGLSSVPGRSGPDQRIVFTVKCLKGCFHVSI